PVAASPVASNDYMQWRSDTVVKAVNTVKPTVVSIISAGMESEGSQMQMIGIGSGVIFQKEGSKAYVVTNNHVVQNASQVEIVLASGEHKRAEIKGRDMITDLAVLEMDADGIKVYAEFGDSGKLQSGETAIAIGNPLGLGFSQT